MNCDRHVVKQVRQAVCCMLIRDKTTHFCALLLSSRLSIYFDGSGVVEERDGVVSESLMQESPWISFLSKWFMHCRNDGHTYHS
jgi:hypothetical protein